MLPSLICTFMKGAKLFEGLSSSIFEAPSPPGAVFCLATNRSQTSYCSSARVLSLLALDFCLCRSGLSRIANHFLNCLTVTLLVALCLVPPALSVVSKKQWFSRVGKGLFLAMDLVEKLTAASA